MESIEGIRGTPCFWVPPPLRKIETLSKVRSHRTGECTSEPPDHDMGRKPHHTDLGKAPFSGPLNLGENSSRIRSLHLGEVSSSVPSIVTISSHSFCGRTSEISRTDSDSVNYGRPKTACATTKSKNRYVESQIRTTNSFPTEGTRASRAFPVQRSRGRQTAKALKRVRKE